MNIKDIKEIGGVKLYLFDNPFFVKHILGFKKDKYSMLWKQHGEYFELKDLGEPFEKNISDKYIIVAMPVFDVTRENYASILGELLLLGGNEINKIEVTPENQTSKIECSDEFWDTLFKTVNSEDTNTTIPSKKYNHFYSKKYIRLIRTY